MIYNIVYKEAVIDKLTKKGDIFSNDVDIIRKYESKLKQQMK